MYMLGEIDSAYLHKGFDYREKYEKSEYFMENELCVRIHNK